jgi:hypothetical protein
MRGITVHKRHIQSTKAIHVSPRPTIKQTIKEVDVIEIKENEPDIVDVVVDVNDEEVKKPSRKHQKKSDNKENNNTKKEEF